MPKRSNPSGTRPAFAAALLDDTLAPPINLPVPKAVAAELDMFRSLYRFIEHREPPRTEDTEADLARRAQRGDDAALLELIRRDPRYLSTPLAIAKLLWWKLSLVYSDHRHPAGAELDTKGHPRAEDARRRLEELAKTIGPHPGSGQHFFVNPKRLLADHRSIQREIESGIVTRRLILGLQRRNGCNKATAERLLRSGVRAKKDLALHTLSVEYGLSPDRLKVLLRDAKRIGATET